MSLAFVQNVIDYANMGLGALSAVFITFVFFDLVFIDKNVQLTNLSEKFEKFKRYDIFRNSLIFLVFSIYFGIFGKLAISLNFPEIAFSVFTLISNMFLAAFVFKLYQLLHKYVPLEEK